MQILCRAIPNCSTYFKSRFCKNNELEISALIKISQALQNYIVYTMPLVVFIVLNVLIVYFVDKKSHIKKLLLLNLA